MSTIIRKAVTIALEEEFQLTIFKASHVDYGYVVVYEDAHGEITVSEGKAEQIIEEYKNSILI